MKPPDSEEQNNVLRDYAGRLEKLGINYMLTGSMALVHYAMPRTTTDIDVVIELTTNDAGKFIKEFEEDFYFSQNRIKDAIYRNRMFNILDQRSIIKIDCVILKHDEFNQNAFLRRQRVNYTEDFQVWIISKEDLIISKLNWAKTSRSEMQMRDVASILRNGYNEDYVNFWAEKLGLQDILQECLDLIDKNYADGYDS